MRGGSIDSRGPLVEPLTRREQEVLRLLAEGCTRPEIAERLTVTLSSVKFHIQNIYGKLGANSKPQALARAGELGLLAQPATPQAPTPEPRLGPQPGLPLQLTSFIGREKEIVEVRRLVSQTRLVTLTGVGGSGKTRLALEAAGGLLGEFSDGVWLVEFAPLAEARLVPQSVATALGLREVSGRGVTAILLDYLRSERLLLMLDNCEHLIEACSQLAHAILQSCPRVHVLATSREGLGIAGETLYPVPSLALPAEAAVLENLVASESGRLFVARARAVAPQFDATAENAGAIAQICRRLDGIPLALELAAARVKVLAPEQIAARLDDRFRLLTGGNRAALERHQTLRAAVDWSYALLAPAERLLLERAAVFDGGWTLEAAEAVCSGDGIEPDMVLDLLAALAGKSLVLVETSGPAARYRMLETIRQFAYEKLVDSGDMERVRQRHLDFYLMLAAEAEPELLRHEQAAWIERLDTELPNIRAADDWAAARSDGRSAVTLAGRLVRFWWGRGFYREADSRFTRALGLPGAADAPAKLRPAALHGAGQFTRVLEDYERAQRLLEESLALSQAEGDLEWAGWSLLILGVVAMSSTNDLVAMRAYFDQGLAVFRAIGDRSGIAGALSNQSWAAWLENDRVTAEMHAVQSLAIHRELGDKGNVAVLQQWRGDIARSQGDLARARACYEEALALYRKLRASTGDIASSNIGLGYVALRQGDHAVARSCFQEILRLLNEDGLLNKFMVMDFAKALGGLGGVAAATGLPVKAARLLGASVAQVRGNELDPLSQSEWDRDIALARAQVETASFDAAWAEGQAMTLEQAVAYALGDDADGQTAVV